MGRPLTKVLIARVAKLIPMLASSFDGEVVAAVAAIRRTLGSEKFDLNDFAEWMTAPARYKAPKVPRQPRPKPKPEPRPEPRREQADSRMFNRAHGRDDCREMAIEILRCVNGVNEWKLSDREREFVDSILRQTGVPTFVPSVKQESWLNAIYIREFTAMRLREERNAWATI